MRMCLVWRYSIHQYAYQAIAQIRGKTWSIQQYEQEERGEKREVLGGDCVGKRNGL